MSESWTRFQAANLPAMLSTLLGWRPGSVRSGTTPAPQPPPGAVVALRLPKVFRDVSAAQLTATIVVFALLETVGASHAAYTQALCINGNVRNQG